MQNYQQLGWMALLAMCVGVWAADVSSVVADDSVSVQDFPPGLQRLVTAIVRDNVPSAYSDNDDWGNQKRVYRGIRFRREGLKLETKRRRKKVNHGTWKRFRMTQIDPEKNLNVAIRDVHQAKDGRAACRIELESRINAYARLSEWNRGVRLFSISVDADTDVVLSLDCRLDVQLDPTRVPPDVILRPEVTQADLRIRRFRVNRISHFDGPVARELGDALEKVLERELEKRRPELVSKINRQIQRHEDKLTLSLTDTIQKKWQELRESSETELQLQPPQ